jgi:hypothetical protein
MLAAIMGTPLQEEPHLKVVVASKLTSFLDFTFDVFGTIKTSE